MSKDQESKIEIGTEVRIMQDGHDFNGWTGIVYRIDIEGYEPYCLKLRCGKYTWAKQVTIVK